MANVSRVNDDYRVRYFIRFPDGSRKDRSRRVAGKEKADELKQLAGDLETKTRHQEYSRTDISLWKREGLISRDDADLLQGYIAGRKTVAQAGDEYKKSLHCCSKEIEERSRRIDRIVDLLGPDRPIDNIRHLDGEAIKTTLKNGYQGTKYKAVTVNKHIQDAKRMFTLQLDKGALEFHPFGVLKNVKPSKEEEIEHTVLSHTDIQKILEEAEKSDARCDKGNPAPLGGNMMLFLLMFFGCGLRRSEALAARLEDIDWHNQSLTLIDSKNGEKRVVGLGERLYSMLLPMRGEKGYILPRFYPNSVSRAISRHFKRCGYKMRLHDTRHTYITRLLDLGVLSHHALQGLSHKNRQLAVHHPHPEHDEVCGSEFPFMKNRRPKTDITSIKTKTQLRMVKKW